MTRFTRTGRFIEQDGQRIATASGEIEAMMILNALRALEVASDGKAGIVPDGYQMVPIDCEMSRVVHLTTLGTKHTRRREVDEYACSCGLRWGIDEDDPHG